MNKNIIIVVVLGVLILISIVQAVQLTGLKSKLATGGTKVSTASQNTVATSAGNTGGQVSVPKSLQNLPNMVGGC